MVHSIKGLEKFIECNRPLVKIINDFFAALDTADLDSVMTLRKQERTKLMKFERGTEQGDTLSERPLKDFTTIRDCAFKELDWDPSKKYYPLWMRRYLKFADDIDPITDNFGETWRIFVKLDAVGARVSSNMIFSKTQFIFNFVPIENVKVGDHEIQLVHKYKLSTNRITLAWAQYGAMADVFWNEIPKHL